MAIQRIHMLGIPIDICSRQDLAKRVVELAESGAPARVSFITVWDFLKARGKSDYAKSIKSADLVLPISKSLIWGAKFLRKDVPVRHNPFDSIIIILTELENRYKSLYILGGKGKTLHAAEKNIKNTFKNLSVVGRCPGHYKKKDEDLIIQAIRKASPSLILASDGIKKRDAWHYLNAPSLSGGVFLYYEDAIGIMSGRVRRIDSRTFEKGHEMRGEILRNPLKIFLVFPFLHYVLLLCWDILFGDED